MRLYFCYIYFCETGGENLMKTINYFEDTNQASAFANPLTRTTCFEWVKQHLKESKDAKTKSEQPKKKLKCGPQQRTEPVGIIKEYKGAKASVVVFTLLSALLMAHTAAGVPLSLPIVQ